MIGIFEIWPQLGYSNVTSETSTRSASLVFQSDIRRADDNAISTLSSKGEEIVVTVIPKSSCNTNAFVLFLFVTFRIQIWLHEDLAPALNTKQKVNQCIEQYIHELRSPSSPSILFDVFEDEEELISLLNDSPSSISRVLHPLFNIHLIRKPSFVSWRSSNDKPTLELLSSYGKAKELSISLGREIP